MHKGLSSFLGVELFLAWPALFFDETMEQTYMHHILYQIFINQTKLIHIYVQLFDLRNCVRKSKAGFC